MNMHIQLQKARREIAENMKYCSIAIYFKHNYTGKYGNVNSGVHTHDFIHKLAANNQPTTKTINAL